MFGAHELMPYIEFAGSNTLIYTLYNLLCNSLRITLGESQEYEV